MNKTALVLEGGAMRGMFIAGNNHIFIFHEIFPYSNTEVPLSPGNLPDKAANEFHSCFCLPLHKCHTR